ncbi:CaiB/BaiF CoA-transferase family protein [Granulicoccus phenolivorans]|uniref:CaiB/BaiF CoA-transferase family protein n=1 Tax=Granulicoccus phenolivorans TaxID=266854 RepID=UPI00040797A2|nr:CoA transferase [Granulicoccus phenolivorans]
MTSADPMSEPRYQAPTALRVVDLATGMAAGLVTRSLVAAGMRVDRVAPAGDEVFDRIYPAHRYWRDGVHAADAADLAELLAAADVCLVGGEDHPDVATRRDAAELAQAYPQLVVVDLSGYVPGDEDGHPAVDLLVQARSGLTFEHYSDRPVYFDVLFPTFGQALLALYGLWAALIGRLDSGRGELVTASLHQGAVFFLMPFWEAAEHPDAEFDKATPKDVKHLIFECADGEFIQFVMGVPQAVKKLYTILEIDREVDPNDVGIPRVGASPNMFFGDRPLIGSHVIGFPREELLTRARAIGLPAAPVLRPGEFWDDPQVAANRLLSQRGDTRVVADPFRVSAITEPTPGTAPEIDRPRSGAGPLAGIRVIDFGSFVAGPFSGRLLADLGADVIKFESLQGDPNRGLQRHYLAVQMGKRAMVVDLKDPRGKQVLDRLVAGTDLMMHNWRVGVPERLGVSPAELRRINPTIITLASLSFGPEGPRATDPGFDMIIQALLGMERRAGGPDGEPLWFRAPYLDYGAGVVGAVAALMALYERRVTGRVADAWGSLLNTGMFLMSDQIQVGDSFAGVPEIDRDLLGTSPTHRLYPVADGWIAIAARSDTQAQALWTELVGNTPAPAHAADWGPAEQELLEARLRELPLADALARLREAGVWAEECRPSGLSDLLASETARATGFCATRPDERYGHLYGAVGQLVTFGRSALDAETLRGAPARGRHTRELLAELGYPDEEIEAMYAAGVVA